MKEHQDLDYANYFRTGGVNQDIPLKLIEDIESFVDHFQK